MNSKQQIASRVAKEFRDGDIVNLGAGLPTLAVNYIPEDVQVHLCSENGIVGFEKANPDLPVDPFCTDAGEQPISITAAGCVVDSCTAFGLIRGKHLKITVLGTMQVDAEGSIANWMIPGGKVAGMGGAMDLVEGAERVIVATEHCAKDGTPKILEKCTFPLTGYGVVNTIITELAYIEVTKEGLCLKEVAPGVSVEEVIQKTGANLIISKDLREMSR
ncbi:3-oxoacid CoA-transferase subunit B [Aminipila butyrica]|uniref:3-oxoacid CoA-transferase subunit B n=1 Tax=Aminipila butyrica TaxID=433296 RepID=A0A858BWS0_9FIRM|nr:3-oxoacid CoA-transferase subunit B [Aminipila butyrica]QIB70383.1 3-oxoacid CoA-transferase subunit B [Aminipila butyrica]